MPQPRRILAALLLAATLLLPPTASAAPLSHAELRTVSPALLTRLWSLLTALWAEAGCLIDPSGGRCAGAQGTAPAPPSALDEGCGLDPSGRCGSSY